MAYCRFVLRVGGGNSDLQVRAARRTGEGAVQDSDQGREESQEGQRGGAEGACELFQTFTVYRLTHYIHMIYYWKTNN